MTRIVRTHYRYKRPPGKRKAVPLEVPAVVTISDKTRKRVRRPDDTTADPSIAQRSNASTFDEPASANDDRKPAAAAAPQTATKSAIVAARRPKARGGNRHLLAELPDTEEEHRRRRGDRADAMMQEFKRQIAEKLRR